MTLTDLQRMVLETIARNRDARSYVAGGAALNRDRARISDDLDIFLDAEGDVAPTVERDLTAPRDAGFSVEETVRAAGTVEAIVRRYGFETRIQWMEETQRRFFPLVGDPRFGVRLHDADLAINKVLCAADRRKPRDMIDLVEIERDYCPLGPLIWAAAAKSGFGPGRIIEEIRANARGYAPEELATVRMSDGSEIDPDRVRERLRGALSRAEHYVMEEAPDDHLGALFVDDKERPVEADAEMLKRGAARAVPCGVHGDGVPTVLTDR
ncbi:MAG: hypothetical protein ACYC1L_06205 [Alphaproteobacteria bacterium]